MSDERNSALSHPGVVAFGFPPNALDALSAALATAIPAIAAEDLPAPYPVLVFEAAAEAFIARAEELTRQGAVQDAVLYLVRGQHAPADDWRYFDRTIAEDDFKALRDLLACPEQFRSELLAQDVSLGLLLARPALLEAVRDHPETLREFALSGRDHDHLTSCSLCRHCFTQALSRRLDLYFLMTTGVA